MGANMTGDLHVVTWSLWIMATIERVHGNDVAFLIYLALGCVAWIHDVLTRGKQT